PIDLGGQRWGDRRLTPIAELGDLAGCTGGVPGDHRGQVQVADHLAALAQGVHVRAHGGDLLEGGTRHTHQHEPDAQEVLGDDVQVGGGQEVVDVGHPAGQGV